MNNLNKTIFIESRIKILLFLIFSFLFFISNLDAYAEYYSWKDEKGVTHIADSIEKIPNKYRKNAKKYESNKERKRFDALNSYNKTSKFLISTFKQHKKIFLAVFIIIIGIVIYKILKNQFINLSSHISGLNNNKNIAMSGIDHMDLNILRSNIVKILMNRNYQIVESESILNPVVDLVVTNNYEKATVTIDNSTNPISIFRLNEINREKHKFLCRKSIIFSRNYFDREVLDFAKANNIELYDKAKLAKLLIKLK